MSIRPHTLLAAAGLALASQTVMVAPAAAQQVRGIGVANLQAVIALSNAFRGAEQQRPTTYKAQIDQANARGAQLQAQLKPLYDKFNADARAANANRAALEQQAAQIQRIEQAGQQELNNLLAPVQLSRAYVVEQITDRLDAATKAAMDKQKITLLLSNEAVIRADAPYNLNQAIVNELNAVLPAAQLVPPAGWMPREQREEMARQQGATAPAPAGTAPAPTPPTGR